MICFFRGLPIRFQKYQTVLIAVSFASEPELAKTIRSIPSGSSEASLAASSIVGGAAHWKKAL